MYKRNVNLILIAGIILTLVMAIAGCTGSTTSDNGATPTPLPSNTVRIGITSSDTMDPLTAYAPLKDYLQKETGYDIVLYKCIDDQVAYSAMQSKKVEVAFTGPIAYGNSYRAVGYGDAATRGKGEVFGIGTDANGNMTRYAYIIGTTEVAQALGITTPLQGTQGMDTFKNAMNSHKGLYSFKWADTGSTYSFGIQRIAMFQSGLNVSDVFSTAANYAADIDTEVKSVDQKKLDIGTASSSTYDRLVASGAISPANVKILWMSDPIPNPPVYYRADLPQDEKDKIKNAILNAPADVLAPTGMSGYKACDQSTYADMPALGQTLESINKQNM